MYRILLPLDASTRALKAIPWTDAYAQALDASVLVARTVDWTGVEVPRHGETGDGLLDSITNAERELEDAAKRFRHVKPRLEVVRGQSDAIMTLAQDEGMDLIVMATHGRTGAERTLSGSVTGETIAASGLPVLSIGPNVPLEGAQAPSTILVPYDGSAFSRTIFPTLVTFAGALKAKLVLFRALETIETLALQGALIPIENPFDPATHDLVRDMEAAAAELRAAGLSVEIAAGFGKAGAAILEAANQEGADLLALTTHSRRGLARWILGSVAEHVVAESPVPVLVFHPRQSEPQVRMA